MGGGGDEEWEWEADLGNYFNDQQVVGGRVCGRGRKVYKKSAGCGGLVSG